VKRQLIVGAAGIAMFVIAGMLAASYVGWWTLPLGAAVVAAAWLGGRCWHRDISLLPPVRGAGPDREYSRWHCNGCGATWAAGLESSTRPRPVYLGYDQAKAEQAASRADTLERERRRLAIERAGLSHRARESKPAQAGPRPVASAVRVAMDTGNATALTRVAGGGRVRRLSVDAGAANLDEARLAHRRSSEDLPRVRPLHG
jgi:hypothetical protein